MSSSIRNFYILHITCVKVTEWGGFFKSYSTCIKNIWFENKLHIVNRIMLRYTHRENKKENPFPPKKNRLIPGR